MSDKNRKAYWPFEIKLAEDGSVPKRVQVLRVGKFSHPTYGDLDITPAMLAEFKKNFDAKVRRVDPAIDYKHENEDVAAGWPKNIELSDEGNSLWFTDIEWTPNAEKVLRDKEFRYFSPEFVTKFTDPETKKVYNNVLFGGGLTNRPFIKDMAPITKLGEVVLAEDKDLQACVASLVPDLIAQGHDQKQAVAIAYSKCGEKRLSELKNKGGYSMDEKDKMIASLKEEIASLKAQLEKSQGSVKASETEVKTLTEKVATLETEKKKIELEKDFNVLLSEGKACAAQKDAYMKGDMKAFAENASKVNLAGAGSGAGAKDVGGDADTKVLKLAEEKMKADKSLSQGAAIRAVLSENKELAAQVQ